VTFPSGGFRENSGQRRYFVRREARGGRAGFVAEGQPPPTKTKGRGLHFMKVDHLSHFVVTEMQNVLVMIRRLIDVTKNFQGDDQC
jgi:hypothetical protein